MGVGRRVAYGGSAVLLALTLAACADRSTGAQPAAGASPTAAPPTRSSGSPTATTSASGGPTSSAPTGVRPVIPAAARAHTSAGAEAFARFYFQQVNDAFQGAGASVLGGLYDEQCKTCTNLARNAEKLHDAGSRLEPAPYVVSFFTELPESTPNVRFFSAALIHRSVKVMRSDGSTSRTEPEEKTLIEMAVSRRNRSWIMHSIAVAKMVNS